MANTQFPREITNDILGRLGVKDLLRYKCVSKPWRSLIDGPDFIKFHLNHSLKTGSNVGLILRSGIDLYWVDLDGALDSAASQLTAPIKLGGCNPILGCCNGLLVIANSRGDVALWNPSTKKHAKISIPDVDKNTISLGVFENGVIGFGHDPVSDDYKILRRKLVEDKYNNYGIRFEPMIYSVKTKTWKRVTGLPDYYGAYRDNHALVGNALHWIFDKNYESGHNSSQVIGAFDLVMEKYREVSLLPSIGKPCRMKLVEFGGCLCLVCSYASERNFSVSMKLDRTDIWVMKEYGVEKSWTKLFTVEPSAETGRFGHAHVEPVVYLKGGDNRQVLLSMDCKRLVSYDLETKRARVLRIPGLPVLKHFITDVCVGSLVGVGQGDVGESSTISTVKQEVPENKINKGNKEKRQSTSGKKRDDFLSAGFKLVL